MHRTVAILAVLQFLLMPFVIAADDIESLIDELAKISEPGVGYSSYFSGSMFLPYEDSEQLGTLVLGGTYRTRPVALTNLVARGAEAVPVLLKHLSDGRPLAMEPMRGMMWMDFCDEYDFNSRVSTEAPPGVNRDSFSEKNRPSSHALTVGDMCFVALGQIVNRNFSATRYQPTGGLIVSSPSYSKRLRDAILKEWSDLTPAEHKRRLVLDFEKSDHLARRIGAYQRLSYYYPEEVEPLVLRVLQRQPYDQGAVFDFCRDVLYQNALPADRKRLYDEFLAKHGEHYAEGVEQQLFDDLELLEAQESKSITPPLKEFQTQPRELLVQLFGRPPGVQSTDRPFTVSLTDGERDEFIASLTHDTSKEIGKAVKQILQQNPDDQYLTAASFACLANRGEGAFLVERLNDIDFSQRQVGWEDLQVFVSIAKSEEPIVKDRLRQIVGETQSEAYFVAAVERLEDLPDTTVCGNAVRLLRALPDDTAEGRELLQLIVTRFPDRAKDASQEFLSKGTARRCETVCQVLWYGHPLAIEILAPMLDDQRELPAFATRLRVCDRAAQAISHTSDELKFDSDWNTSARNAAIAKLKIYCAEHAK